MIFRNQDNEEIIISYWILSTNPETTRFSGFFFCQIFDFGANLVQVGFKTCFLDAKII
jgi:hypothetical protein